MTEIMTVSSKKESKKYNNNAALVYSFCCVGIFPRRATKLWVSRNIYETGGCIFALYLFSHFFSLFTLVCNMRKLYYTNTEKKLSLNIDRELFIVNEKVTKYKDDFWLRLHIKLVVLSLRAISRRALKSDQTIFVWTKTEKNMKVNKKESTGTWWPNFTWSWVDDN